jgi:glycosidase
VPTPFWDHLRPRRDAVEPFFMLAALLPGMPLVYGGQEAYFEKRLQFFEKDAIAWNGYPLAGFYSRLLALKKRHPALANVPGGGRQIEDGANEAVFAFTRRGGGRRLRVVVNLSGQLQPIAGGGALAPWAWRIQA